METLAYKRWELLAPLHRLDQQQRIEKAYRDERAALATGKPLDLAGVRAAWQATHPAYQNPELADFSYGRLLAHKP